MIGDEADADWNAGLVEWGIEEAKAYCRDRVSGDAAGRKDRRRRKRKVAESDARE